MACARLASVELEILLQQHGPRLPLDEIEHLGHHPIEERAIVGNGDGAELGIANRVVRSYLRGAHVEAIPDAVQQASNDLPLVLQGEAVSDFQHDSERSDMHLFGNLENGAAKLPFFHTLDDVPHLHVVEVLQHDPTLEALSHLAYVVLQVAH